MLRLKLLTDLPVSFSVVEIEMFACSNDLFLFGMIQTTLETRNQLLGVLLSMERIFTRHLLTSTPARIKESVDIGYV